MATSKTEPPIFSEGAPPTIEYRVVKPNELTIDPRVQRPRDDIKLNNMLIEFDQQALGQITLSQRPDGTLIVLDGQHRTLLVAAVGYQGGLYAKVYRGLTLQQEARLFRLLNNTTKAGRLALFNVALTEGDPRALAINDVLRKYGLTMTAGSFAAVAAAERIARRKDGLAALDWAIDVTQRTWGQEAKYLDGRVIEALSMLRLRDGLDIKTDTLVAKLAGQGSVSNLLGTARTVQQVRNGTLHSAMAATIVGAYNKSLKKDENKLRPWD
jgi:hypothetical protein